jgi:hypothetical protein
MTDQPKSTKRIGLAHRLAVASVGSSVAALAWFALWLAHVLPVFDEHKHHRVGTALATLAMVLAGASWMQLRRDRADVPLAPVELLLSLVAVLAHVLYFPM